MNKLPFSLFRRGKRKFFYVVYKNAITGKNFSAISTKKEKESEAMEVAFAWYKNGVVRGNEVVQIKNYSLRDITCDVDLCAEDAYYICQEFKKRGFIKDYILPKSKKAIPISNYLLNFWDWNRSEYIQEKLRKNHGIHKRYTIEMMNLVRLYWLTYFKDKLLGDITRNDVNEMVKHLQIIVKETEKRIECLRNEEPNKKIIIKYPKSPKQKNKILKSCFIPIRYAFRNGDLDSDPTSGIIMFSGESKKRNILPFELVTKIFDQKWDDPRSKIANILAAITGMRACEIQALKIRDIGTDCIYVNNSWNSKDKLKPTKNNESRRVEVPFPWLIQALIELSKLNPHGINKESYIFWAAKDTTKPIEGDVFLRDLRKYLVKSGLSKEIADEYCFHGWRHFFTTYMKNKGKVEDKVLKCMTGHKSLSMLYLYSDHELNDEREKIQIAQKEIFGKLLPTAFGEVFNDK